jgi:hypothetical protein
MTIFVEWRNPLLAARNQNTVVAKHLRHCEERRHKAVCTEIESRLPRCTPLRGLPLAMTIFVERRNPLLAARNQNTVVAKHLRHCEERVARRGNP